MRCLPSFNVYVEENEGVMIKLNERSALYDYSQKQAFLLQAHVELSRFYPRFPFDDVVRYPWSLGSKDSYHRGYRGKCITNFTIIES